jgi:hypothetical protein
MTYQMVTHDDGYHIKHVEADQYVGWLTPLKTGGFRVHRDTLYGGGRQMIGIISFVDEAVPTIAAYYEKHPPRWLGGAKAKRYEKRTFYGALSVERQGRQEWVVERSGDILKREGAPADFATSDEAKQAADLHLQDGFPNSEPVEDGLSWYNYLRRIEVPASKDTAQVSFF